MEEERIAKKNQDWSELRSDILELLSNRLTLSDQVRFDSVCKPRFSSAITRTYPQACDGPWLVTPYYSLPDLSKKYYLIPKPVRQVPDELIAGSFKGWVLIRSENEYRIQNLSSKVLFDLPSPSTMLDFMSHKGLFIRCSGIIRVFAISFCSNMNPTIIAVVTPSRDLALCKIGDGAWKGYRRKEAYANLTFYNGKLYAVDKPLRKVDIFKVDDDLKLLHVGSIYSPEVDRSFKSQAYLVESQGDLLFVKRYCDSSDSWLAIDFKIYKVEDECNPTRFTRVDTLKDQVLFVGHRSSESLAAKDCPTLFKGNHIYFIGMPYFGLSSRLGIYSIEDKTLNMSPVQSHMMDDLNWVLQRLAVECDGKCHSALPYIDSI